MARFFQKLSRRARALLQPGAVDREIAAEIEAHIEQEALSLQQTQGLTANEARRQAMVAFGGVDRFTEEHRDVRGVRPLHEFIDDVRYSMRTLSRSPAYTISATLVLALGIGATAAMFSAVDAVLLARLPYQNDEQLVRLFQQNSPTNRWTMSLVDMQAVEQYSHSFSSVGAVRTREVGVSAGSNAERHAVGYINAGFVRTLGVEMAAGRAFIADDERPEQPATVVLGYKYAVDMFGSAQDALDHVVIVDAVPHRVVGVFKAEDARPAFVRADLWPVLKQATPKRRGPFGMYGIARLKPGATLESARRDLSDVSVRIFPEWQAGFQDKVARITPYSLRETIIGKTRQPLLLFTGAVVLVLLIAVSNVAGLSIVRSVRRWRETSLRAMLGASRGRLVRLMVTESVVLAGLSAVAGLGLGWVGLKLLQKSGTGIPRLNDAHIDERTVAVALTVAIIAGIAIGVFPALRFLREQSDQSLRDGTRAIGDGAHSNRLRSAFVSAEFALALPVLAAGALLLNSLMQLQRVDPGFTTEHVQTVRVGIPASTYPTPADITRFWQDISHNIAQIPGVVSAGFSTAVPPNDQGNSNDNYDLVDSPVAPGAAQPTVTWPSVDNAFFATLGVRLLEGRLFVPTDTVNGPPVVVVTRSWANRTFPGRSVLGRQMIQGGCTSCPRTTIVGVVSDITFDQLSAAGDAVFSPTSDSAPTQLNLFVKTAVEDASISRRVRAAVGNVDAAASFGPMSSLEDGVYQSMAQPRHWAMILMTFAVAALIMAAVGIFGLLSYAVELRRREIGVRMALGASSNAVVGSMIANGMRYAVVGAAIGLVLTFGVARWLSAMLFNVSAFDPFTLVAVTSGLLVVAFVASWLPARRVAAIDPMDAMRPE